MGRRIASLQRRRWIIGAGIIIALAVAIPVVLSATNRARAHAEVHPHADLRLLKITDGGRIIGFHANCSDMTDLGYMPDNLCIDYLLVGSRSPRTEQAFQHDEVKRLDHAVWRLFSPKDFGLSSTRVVGRTDLYGHDCLLIGPPALVPFASEPYGEGPAPAFWSQLREELQRARRQGLTVIGMQLYPGPANDAYHRVC
jgi:hypothetical protein